MKRREQDGGASQGPVTEAEFRRVLELCASRPSTRDVAEVSRIAGVDVTPRWKDEERAYNAQRTTQEVLTEMYLVREDAIAPQLRHGQDWRWMQQWHRRALR